MGQCRVEFLLEDNIWSPNNTIAKKSQYTEGLTELTFPNLNFTEKNYGNKLTIDQIETAPSDTGFSNISITHSV